MRTHRAPGLAPGVDQGRFREVVGHFASGVVAVTGYGPDGGPTGLTVSSFTSVSLEPPLVSFCAGHTSRTWPLLRTAPAGVCVNILSDRQEDVSGRLGRSGGRKFEGLAWSPSPDGLPMLEGSLAWLEGSVEAELRAGDHDIVVLRVRRLTESEEAAEAGPLIHYRGGYRQLARRLRQG